MQTPVKQWISRLTLSLVVLHGWVAPVWSAVPDSPFHFTSKYIMTYEEFLQWRNQQSHTQNLVHAETPSEEDHIHKVSLSSPSKVLTGHIQSVEYHLGPGDSISVNVMGHRDLKIEEFVIHGDGILPVPLIGNVQVEGKTQQELQEEIATRMAQYLIEPQVQVLIKKTRPRTTYVMGAVKNPGPYVQISKDANNPNKTYMYTFQNDYNLSTALSNAGGVLEDADIRHVMIFNDAQDYIREINLFDLLVFGDASQDMDIRADDVIYIPRMPSPEQVDVNLMRLVANSTIGKHAFPIKIHGLVRQPNIYKMKPDEMTLQAAIARGGGLLPGADLKKVLIARVTPDGELEKMIVDASARDVLLRPNDTIIVDEFTGITRMANAMETLSHIINPVVKSSFFLRNVNNVWHFGTDNSD